MAPVTEVLSADGPVVPVAIGHDPRWVQSRRAEGQQATPPELCRALIDTGAACTVVDLRLIREFQLQPTGLVELRSLDSGGGRNLRQRYRVGFTFTLPRVFTLPKAVEVIGVDLFHHNVQVLIGRDLLRLCRFGYDGPAGQFTLDY